MLPFDPLPLSHCHRYIYKGPDRTSFAVTEVSEDTVDTIKQWKSLRCLSATEAAWRCIIHDMHFRQPAAEGQSLCSLAAASLTETPPTSSYVDLAVH